MFEKNIYKENMQCRLRGNNKLMDNDMFEQCRVDLKYANEQNRRLKLRLDSARKLINLKDKTLEGAEKAHIEILKATKMEYEFKNLELLYEITKNIENTNMKELFSHIVMHYGNIDSALKYVEDLFVSHNET